jgi:aldehyde:ferredoxin oxidoreductase
MHGFYNTLLTIDFQRKRFAVDPISGIIDPEVIEGKAEVFTEWEDRLTIFDGLILCRFYRDLYQWGELATIINGITGLNLDLAGMRSIARDITDNTRRFNLREGLTQEEDRLPKRLHTDILPETGKGITEEQMEKLLSDYYKVRGRDKEGRPAPEGR